MRIRRRRLRDFQEEGSGNEAVKKKRKTGVREEKEDQGKKIEGAFRRKAEGMRL